MRVAVLADIHGNLPALEAVLADVGSAGADLIVLNGDLADGPFPAETLDRLMALGERGLWVRGNGDRWLTEARDGRFRHDDDATARLIEWASARLTDVHRTMLAALPSTRRVAPPGFGTAGFCHATARSDDEMILVDSSMEHYRAAFEGLDAPTIVVGHSHMPFDRLFDRRRIVNTGSVGMPYGHAGASWALIDRDIVLRRTLYDVEAAAARIARTGMPDAEEFIRTCVRSTPSDRDVLEAFHAVARKQAATRLT